MIYTALAALTLSSTGIVLSLTLLMALFLGWENPLIDRGNLVLGVLGALAAVTGAMCLPGLQLDGGSTLRGIWRRVPAWLVVFQVTLVVLAALAWLAVWLAEYTSGTAARDGHGLPVLVLLVSASAFTVAYAQASRQLAPQRTDGPRRHAGPDRSGDQ